MARAVCALESVSRWTVTGTPIQNHINDLAALLKFLNVYPYGEKRVFDADISHVWKTGKADEAVKRLKRLAGCLLLRRPKGTVQLPPRHDQALYVELDHQERALYDKVRTQVIARIDESLISGTGTGSTFVSILQQIEAMRLVANLGLLYPSRHDVSATVNNPAREDWMHAAQRVFNIRFDMGPIQCYLCHFALDPTCNPINDADSPRQLFCQCLRFICSGCVQAAEQQKTGPPSCGDIPPCPIAEVSTNPSSLEESSLPVSVSTLRHATYQPTKVKALVADIEGQADNVKW